MKIRIEIDDGILEDEVIIRCSEISAEVLEIQNMILDRAKRSSGIEFYKNDKEYYISLSNVLFFETNANKEIDAHTRDEVYKVKYKLYELEEILPSEFVRVSKSAIININKIHSILKNITSTSLVEFKNTEKKLYVSRNYYKDLKLKLSEKRMGV
ncbi:MAG: LytTR family DNA-binding domain-containing protein [Clostridium sp.]|uniref:LytTR family DNA-binding domain-containing protein n=1 Tax=Clostridium sp. TaxID=1506 RepID=UPI003F3C598B